MIMLGGSPLMVAAPPRLAQKISGKIMYTGLNFRIRDSSTVMAAMNSTTVMLSMNMASTAERSMKLINRGATL